MNKYRLSFLSAVFLCVLQTIPALGRDLRALYSRDYDGFWRQWNNIKNEAISCDKPEQTASFFSGALELLGNAEVTEANAQVIEDLAINEPECLFRGLNIQDIENQKKFIKNFLLSPLFHDTTAIEKSLNRIWDRQLYNDLKTIFNEMKKRS